jgi:hypothetical protein
MEPIPGIITGKIIEGHGKMAIRSPAHRRAHQRPRSRGLLDSTLLVWAGEFGRTPFAQGSNGRDHNPYGFTVWMAGGGVKGGHIYGATDDFGYNAIENVCTVYDMWATVLHLMGIDHEQLTYRFSGRDLRLTDVHGNVDHGLVTAGTLTGEGVIVVRNEIDKLVYARLQKLGHLPSEECSDAEFLRRSYAGCHRHAAHS